MGSWVQHKTREEGQRTDQPKHCECNNENENNSPNTLTAIGFRIILKYINNNIYQLVILSYNNCDICI